MACPCSAKKPRAAGRKVRAAKDSTARQTITAASTSAGKWSTTCSEPGAPVRSLIKAQRAAKACGGRVVPA